MKIGEKTIDRGGELLVAAMRTYLTKINQGFKSEGEKALKIGLSLEISAGPTTGTFNLEAGINFITERIKDSFSCSVDEEQLSLFDEPTRLCPVTGLQTVESYCSEKCGLLNEMLIPDAERPDFIQYRPCSAWADEFTAANVQALLQWEPEDEAQGPVTSILHTYRIQHKQTKEWWQGEAASAADACILAGWNSENCEIKVGGPGAWRKCRELEDPFPCDGCTHHRLRPGSTKKGVTIPGAPGKCLRDGGICDVVLERIGEAA